MKCRKHTEKGNAQARHGGGGGHEEDGDLWGLPRTLKVVLGFQTVRGAEYLCSRLLICLPQRPGSSFLQGMLKGEKKPD